MGTTSSDQEKEKEEIINKYCQRPKKRRRGLKGQWQTSRGSLAIISIFSVAILISGAIWPLISDFIKSNDTVAKGLLAIAGTLAVRRYFLLKDKEQTKEQEKRDFVKALRTEYNNVKNIQRQAETYFGTFHGKELTDEGLQQRLIEHWKEYNELMRALDKHQLAFESLKYEAEIIKGIEWVKEPLGVMEDYLRGITKEYALIVNQIRSDSPKISDWGKVPKIEKPSKRHDKYGLKASSVAFVKDFSERSRGLDLYFVPIARRVRDGLYDQLGVGK
ncbi:MAG: hypothetical protein AAFX87_16665 [Bacteroidota bacterium]